MFVDRRAVAKLDARLARQGEALALLTETSEVGFGAVARELERLGSAPVKASRKPTTRRIATQARKGRTVTEIAADEQISEGEVSLRLHLAGYPGAMEDASCRAVHTSR
jgi:ABC-type hemin transport system ATPase subunit